MQEAEQGTDRTVDEAASRRRFMGLVGGAGAATAMSILVAACGEEEPETGGEATTATEPGEEAASEPGTDLEIVKYALFLEYFERIFYDQVLKSGEVQDSDLRKLIEDIYDNETEHAKALAALVQQLAGTPVQQPKTKFASVIDGGEDRILDVAAMLENIGAAAYLGQGDKIVNDDILEAALSIHSVEARHAAALNEIAGFGFRAGKLEGSVPNGPFAKPMTRAEVLEQVAPYLEA